MIKTAHLNLIRKIAWTFHKSSGIDWDELYAEGLLAYCEALHKHDINKSKKTTWIYNCVRNRLIDFTKKEKKNLQSMEGVDVIVNHTPFFEIYDALNEEGREIINVIFDNPHIFLSLTPRMARKELAEILLQLNWSWSHIWKGVKSIKKELSQIV